MIFEAMGVSMYYEVHGEAKKPLLLLHGWGGKCESFLPVIRDFQDTHTIYVVDQAGHGRSSEPPVPWSADEYADIIALFIEKMGIAGALRAHRGCVMGYSAGAVIQLDRYHLSPDADYSDFGYYTGLGYVSGFAIEVHYEGRAAQNASVARVLAERNLPVYISHTGQGGIVVTEDGIRVIGGVELRSPTK